ncbi:hypothetical protein [Streptomyces sp. NPDC002573]|uniref:hypothetical protein n=1 Tax=Streptomyces sp. NPDC002573 TaxID=3364651 RepID=UPI0036ACDEBE
MGRRLAAAVHVRHPKSNEWLILLPGEEPDEDLAEVITNPAAWEPDEDGDGGQGEAPAGGTDLGPEPTPTPDPTPTPEAEPEPEKPRTRTRKQADEK